jgi:uncharacterized protein (DUF1684 family)
LSLLDWRRRVAELYAAVRASADPRTGHDLWRAGRNNLLKTHPDSPLPPEARQQFSELRVARYDGALRWELELDTRVAPRRLNIATEPDGIVPFERIGVLHLPAVGDLDVWWLAAYGGGVFIPFRDRTAGVETYGGGRYLIDTVKGADLGGSERTLIIDLNFAYNPSCAYDPAWACPLPPEGNVLAVTVHAGELAFD